MSVWFIVKKSGAENIWRSRMDVSLSSRGAKRTGDLLTRCESVGWCLRAYE